MSGGTRAHRALFYAAVVVILAAPGCAKRPAVTQASAPPPTMQAAPAPAPAPAPPPVAAAPPAAAPTPAPAPAPPPAPTARPAPEQFAAAKELPDIYFDFDKATIRPDAAQTLQSSADWLKTNTKSAVLVEGHCDERGTNEYNMALGDRRAKATRDFLVSQGVASSRITTISYGEERPTCTEHNEQCWSKNRRAHLVVKPE